MKLQDPVQQKTAMAIHWQHLSLPIGLKTAAIRTSPDKLDLALPDFGEEGLILTFVNYKGDLLVRSGRRPDEEGQPASPGMGLLSVADRPLAFRSSGPIHFSALVLFIPALWIRVFLKSNAHAPLLLSTSKVPKQLTPLTVTSPFHTPSDGTSRPSAIFRILDDGTSADNRFFAVRYIFSSIALASAPSSNTLRNLTVSPFGPFNSTPYTNGMLVSPASFFLWLPTLYRSEMLLFRMTLYTGSVVSGITTTSSGKTPSPLVGVYSLLVGLSLSLNTSSSYLGAIVCLLGSHGVVGKVPHFTSTTLPLFPGQSAGVGAQVLLRHTC